MWLAIMTICIRVDSALELLAASSRI